MISTITYYLLPITYYISPINSQLSHLRNNLIGNTKNLPCMFPGEVPGIRGKETNVKFEEYNGLRDSTGWKCF